MKKPAKNHLRRLFVVYFTKFGFPHRLFIFDRIFFASVGEIATNLSPTKIPIRCLCAAVLMLVLEAPISSAH